MLKVMFVDDEPFIMQGLSMIIDWARYGYEIIGTASNGREALEKIRKKRPDLVIADIKMPEMNGFEMVEAVRHEGMTEISFIMLSGYNDFEYARRALQDGCLDYLLKPIDQMELVAVIERVRAEKEKEKKQNVYQSEGGTAPIVRYFQGFNYAEKIADVEHVKGENEGNGFSKKLIDELIYAVEVNRRPEIEQKSEALYEEMRELDDFAIQMEINYILFQLLHLANVVDKSLDQQEVLQFISDSVLEQSFSDDVGKGLTKMMLDYGEYLVQLRGNQSQDVLSDIEADIRSHFAENLTLKEMGAKYYLNAAYLGQIFKKQYGESFKDYLNRVRIEKAEDLLLCTDRKIYEIAEQVGYKDVDYFIDKFIALKGCTPAKFRKNYKTTQG